MRQLIDIAVGAAAAFLLSGCVYMTSDASSLPRFETVAAGEPFPISVPSSFSSKLGWLVVPENREDPRTRDIRLPVAIVHSKGVTGAPPVVYLSGGPGTSGLSAAAYPGAYPWLASRDFIVIGQRGTHDAHPALMCPEYSSGVAEGGDLTEAARQCAMRLRSQGIDLDAYHSDASASDLEDLRQVLGIDTWSLYGVSYGTRLALTYLRHHSDHVASMVLDSPLPPNAIFDDESAGNLERTLRAIAADCKTDESCNEAFPDLEARFFRTIAIATQTPLVREQGGSPISGEDLVGAIPLGSGEEITYAPFYMDAAARVDPELLAGLNEDRTASDLAWGMRFSVWCSEALPASKTGQGLSTGEGFAGIDSAAIDPDICSAWNVADRSDGAAQPVQADVPALILAGEFDAATPPRWGELAARTLPNSLVVTVRGEGHLTTQQWGGDGCALQLAAAFFESPQGVLESRGEGACVFDRPSPAYVTSLTEE